MAMIVANNLNAISTARNLNINNNAMSKSLEKLSSGYKINNGADDPSGLVISEQLRAQNAGLQRAVQNTQEANNVLGIAEGALNEMNNILKKMRQLAIHAANNGVTSPEQIAADQAEVDSSIQTIDRIARTTRYSDQFLLNGNKQLSYSSSLLITDSMDMKLIDESLSDLRQIFKTKDFKLNINFSGLTTDASGNTISNGNEARKGYFEISKSQSAATQLNTGYTGSDRGLNYTLTKDQAFTISGNGGSRYLSFAKGTHLGEMATSINSVTDSTGVRATLIFDSDTTVAGVTSGTWQKVGTVLAGTTQIDNTATHTSGMADAFNRNALGEITTVGVTAISVASDNGILLGHNVDGYGRMYLKMLDDDTFALYKDESMTMKVGEGDVVTDTGGSATTTIISSNNSGISGISLTFSSGLQAGSTTMIQLGILHEDTVVDSATAGSAALKDGVDMSDLISDAQIGTNDSFFNVSGSFFSGVKLGENTSDTGKLFIKASLSSSGASSVYVYKDARMRDEDLVGTSGDVNITGGGSVRIYGVNQSENGPTSGLYGTLNFNEITQDLSIDGSMIEFTNLGLRISANDYGSDQFVKLEAHEGAVFSRYSDVDGAKLMDAGLTGTSWTEYGSDAVISLNGQKLTLNGITGEVANLDTQATLVFHGGGLGTTTLAAVGYDQGAWGSRASMIYDDDNNTITHALKSTTETLSDFKGGMQFQLGEGSGDQERTVFSIRSASATDLGRVKFFDKFEGNMKTDKYLSLNDMLSGGWASLGSDAVKALTIIDQAIKDVSNLRAQIGAFQSNMLTTNANSLNVAIENISKTESYIRDADMAYESTQFSKNQIMVQAGTSMLAQANQSQQGVLSLLG